MGGLYHYRWSCNNCDFNDVTVRGPFRVEPSDGTPLAIIEYRWCNNCNSIRRTFTGKGGKYFPGDEPNSKIKRWQYRNLQELANAIHELETKKQRNFLFFFSKDSKKLKELKEKIPLYIESENICEKLSQENITFYEKLNPDSRCLICGSNHVSKYAWDEDKHRCGGSFIRIDNGRFGSVSSCQVITYDKYGNPTSEMRAMH